MREDIPPAAGLLPAMPAPYRLFFELRRPDDTVIWERSTDQHSDMAWRWLRAFLTRRLPGEASLEMRGPFRIVIDVPDHSILPPPPQDAV